MSLDFPNAPADGERSTQDNGVTYQWDATKTQWTSINTLGAQTIGGTVVQQSFYKNGELADSAATIPRDDNVVEITDGFEFMSTTFTPKYATSLIQIDVVFNCALSAVGDLCIALFQDAIVNSLGNVTGATVASRTMSLSLSEQVAAGTVDARTYRVRAGMQSGTVHFNGGVATRLHAGTQSSTIIITEIQPNAITPVPLQPSIAQIIESEVTDLVTSSTVIPVDDTIPQITEGTELLTAVITPDQIGSRIEIQFNVPAIYLQNAAVMGVFALFKDTDADSLSAMNCNYGSTGNTTGGGYSLSYTHITTSLSPITFSVRFGVNSSGRVDLNAGGGTRQWNGVSRTTLKLTEIIPTAPQTPSNIQNATAWVRWDGATGGGNVILAGFNVASIVLNSAGNYTLNFETPMLGTNYAVVVSCGGNHAFVGTITTDSVVIQTANNAHSPTNQNRIGVIIFGDGS